MSTTKHDTNWSVIFQHCILTSKNVSILTGQISAETMKRYKYLSSVLHGHPGTFMNYVTVLRMVNLAVRKLSDTLFADFEWCRR
jgi:hypothetical protein